MAPSPVEANVHSGVSVSTDKGLFDEKLYRVPETISFPDEEEKTLKFWSENEVFKKCLEQSEGKPK